MKHEIPVLKTSVNHKTTLEYPASGNKIEGFFTKFSLENFQIGEPKLKINCSIQYPCTKKDVLEAITGTHQGAFETILEAVDFRFIEEIQQKINGPERSQEKNRLENKGDYCGDDIGAMKEASPHVLENIFLNLDLESSKSLLRFTKVMF
jgi:hypothetical protein